MMIRVYEHVFFSFLEKEICNIEAVKTRTFGVKSKKKKKPPSCIRTRWVLHTLGSDISEP